MANRARPAALLSLAAVASVLALAAILSVPSPATAASAPVGLGTAKAYSVLGGQTVTNIGPSKLSDGLGVSPGTAITGFPPGIVGGATHAGDAAAGKAQADLVVAYDDAASRAPKASIAGDLVGQTLTAGAYKSTGPIALSGTLTLDGQGNPNAVFIFQIASTLITASASKVNMINAGQACNVFWQVGSSATLGTASTFKGTIMALTSITVTTGTLVKGRALARNGQVSLDNDTFSAPECATPTTTTAAVTTTTAAVTTTTAAVTTSTAAATTTSTSTTAVRSTSTTSAGGGPSTTAAPTGASTTLVGGGAGGGGPGAGGSGPGAGGSGPGAGGSGPGAGGTGTGGPGATTPTGGSGNTVVTVATAGTGSTPATTTPGTTGPQLPVTGAAIGPLLAAGAWLVLMGCWLVRCGASKDPDVALARR